MEIITDRLPNPPHNAYCSIDFEVFGMNPKQLHRPNSGTFACCSFCYEPGIVYVCQDVSQLPQYFDAVQDTIWLIQNSKFDLVQARRWVPVPPRTRLVDTMLMERILWNGWYDKFGLDDLARRYLDIPLDKTLQKSFEKSAALSPEQIAYAATDADVTLRCWNEQKKHITQGDMKIWKEIDLPALWAVLDFQGFRLDVDRWKSLAEDNKQKQKLIDEQLPFNPRSPKQVVKFMQEHGYKGIRDSQADTLEEWASKHPDKEATSFAMKVLESRKYGVWAGRYGMNFIEDYLEKDGDCWVIVSDYNVTAAETGRMAASDPGMMQIPSRETDAFRKCFIPRPGNVLIVGDWSSQEPRITAYLTGDRHLTEIFRRKGCNVYIETAKDVFNKEITKKDPLYKRTKSTFLGIDYGMSPNGLALREGISVDEAKELLNTFFKVFPSVASWVEQQKRKQTMVQTVAGRKIWLNPYSDQCERNALNGPHQGTAADMMKKFLSTAHQEWKFDCPFACVGAVHDEAIFDVPIPPAYRVWGSNG